MPDTLLVRVFVSSPGDVFLERLRLEEVVKALDTSVGEGVTLQAVRWENAWYKAHETWQKQIPEAADCDIVIGILGHRLGTPLPPEFEQRQPDGRPYPSGTAYELLTALQSAERRGNPDVYVFTKTTEPQYTLSQRAEYEAGLVRFEELKAFIDSAVRSSHPYDTVETFGNSVAKLLRDWVETKVLRRSLLTVQRHRNGSPFRGLHSFDAADADIFFGRDRKVRRAIRELEEAAARKGGLPFLVIVGPSGAGKSSLMRAGLAPRLTALGAVEGIGLWRTAVMRPGGAATPIAALAKALLDPGTGKDNRGFGPALPELAASPFATEELLAGALRPAANPAVTAAPVVAALDAAAKALATAEGLDTPPQSRLLLLVDQLEELFAATLARQDQVDFAQVLTALAQSGRVWIASTLRADLFGDMVSLPQLLALKQQGRQYDLAFPGVAELVEILAKSAEAAGVVYGEDPATGDRLDDRLLRDAQGVHNLPLLQVALQTLFTAKRPRAVVPPGSDATHELPYEVYVQNGGLENAINKTVQDALKALGSRLPIAAAQARLPKLLRSLAMPVSGFGPANAAAGFTSRSLSLYHAAPDEETRALVNALLDARILVATSTAVEGWPGERTAVLRIAHDKVLSNWSDAAKIIREHYDFFRIRDELERQAQRWRRERDHPDHLIQPGRPLVDAQALLNAYGSELEAETHHFIYASLRRETRRKRLRSAAFAGVTMLAVLAAGFGVVASTAARQAQARLESAFGLADDMIRMAEGLHRTEGIGVEAVDASLGSLSRVLAALEERQAAEAVLMGGMVDRVAGSALRGLGAAGDAEAQLARTRAAMLYQFGRIYHETNRASGKARGLAEESLEIRQDLARRVAGTVQPSEVAASHELMADIDRSEGEGRRQTPAGAENLRIAQVHAEAALPLRRAALAAQPEQPDHALGLARVLTRLGDLVMLRPGEVPASIAAARPYYQEAERLTRQVLARHSDRQDAIEELAWTLRKANQLFTMERRFDDAREALSQEACVRRYLLTRREADLASQRNLGFTLFFLGLRSTDAGVLGAALDAHMDALQHRQRVAMSDRRSRDSDMRVGDSLLAVARTHLALNDPTLAVAFAEVALAQFQDVGERFPDARPSGSIAGATALRDRSLQAVGPAPVLPILDEGPRRQWARGIVARQMDLFGQSPPDQHRHNGSCTGLGLPGMP